MMPTAVSMFQAIDPDNTDGYQAKNNTGFATTSADTLNFLTFLSSQARAQGLGIGLKNTLELIAGNVGLWDFAVNEQCYDYTECNYYIPFQAGMSAGGAHAWCASGAEYKGSYSLPRVVSRRQISPSMRCGV